MQSTSKVIGFVLVLTSVVALVLALMSTALKPIQEKNEELYNKRSLLLAVEPFLDKPVAEMKDDEVEGIFKNNIKQEVVNYKGEVMSPDVVKAAGYNPPIAEKIDLKKEYAKPEEERLLPVFIFSKGPNVYTIVSVRGNGLWDAIWGNIAFEKDMNTIAGASFDHVGETPGLGAEIKDNPKFPKEFVGKKIYDDKGDYVSIKVMKNGGKLPHAVDAITGATITCDGVSKMMYKGLEDYNAFFEKNKK